MQLVSISYQLKGLPNTDNWELNNLKLNKLNLLVGKNATGKSRTIQLISSFSKMIAQKVSFIYTGNWKVIFKTKEDKKFIYSLEIGEIGVLKESINLDGKELLKRGKHTKIYSYKNDAFININPPENKLTLHVRRDKEEFPFFEKLVKWAEQTYGFKFSNITPYSYYIDETDKLTSVDIIPNLLKDLFKHNNGQNKETYLKNIITNFNALGYLIEDIVVSIDRDREILMVKETHLDYYLPQKNLSQGMFRSLTLLIFLEYLVMIQKVSTVLIDDLCEGLDYDRASKLGKILFERYEDKNIQLIVTTNDSFLMDVINIKYWSILRREGDEVKALNYNNSKDLFEKFRYTGLSNFDLFSSDYLLS